MTAKHTPGPWTLSKNGRYVRYGGKYGWNICDLDVFGGPLEESQANACLIAAVPDLLESCEELKICLSAKAESECSESERDMIERAESAISAAKGEL